MPDKVLVHRAATLLEQEVDGELVALHVETGTCYGFNLPATRIWAMIEEPKTVGEIRDALLEQFEIDAATCEVEVAELLQRLAAEGLVKFEPAS